MHVKAHTVYIIYNIQIKRVQNHSIYELGETKIFKHMYIKHKHSLKFILRVLKCFIFETLKKLMVQE